MHDRISQHSIQRLDLEKRFSNYFGKTLQAHGTTYLGVDWKSPEAQLVRFAQIVKVFTDTQRFSVNDLGCGYGALYDYMKAHGFREFYYFGYDLCPDMIEAAKKKFQGQPLVHLIQGSALEPHDYTVASGIFDLKLDISSHDWQEHVLETIAAMAKASNKAFAFNCRSKYSDPEYIKEQMFYGDPCFLFDWCKRNFSRHVALLHDYEAYDFTIIVRKC
jgi:SAM-dependent methyltransferase